MKSCQMYRFIPIILLCVCLFTGGCSQNKDQPSATHNQTPATEAASHTDPPHRYLPRRQTAPKLLQQILQLLISPTRKKDILWQNTPVPMQNPNCSWPGPHGRFCTSVPFSIIICLDLSLHFWYCIICMILYHTDLGRVLFLGQKLAMTVASGRVANCLYLVLSSGLDSNIGLTLARELVNNPHMQALIDKCHENIRHGESFDKALLLSGIFSQMYASWIVIGSRTGEMESIVSQREINTDTASYLTALRAALRQINGIIYTSAAENMIAMDSSILQLYKDGRIDKHTAISEAVNPEIMSKRLNLL